ncbi:DUF4907 domain-containing protein [Aquimarina litoralis]|uniref:DUF4907 domain-containing protein n=1 Tax=Aquimarina litoralis TaxID=584605 RepID=UPI001C58780F|nr:DUF4907 domain-containing protein [Aquimarina litoralis]MBW1294108.1 DUF4907 domain-containing protein [Aquimarina litoralis]
MKKFLRYSITFTLIVSSAVLLILLTQKTVSNENEYIYTLRLKELSGNTWYYEIYTRNKLIIKQETIPGISKIQYFNTKEEAEKIGLLVIRKLKSGIIPTISINELNQYDITFKK